MKITVLAVAAVLSGCAYFSPQRQVEALDPTGPRYNTPECAAARKAALDYDDRMAERVGAGAGLGRAGPVGIIAAMQIDMAQHQKREAVKAEIDKNCT